MPSPSFSCTIYVSELEAAWLKQFVNLLASVDDDESQSVGSMGAAAAALCERLHERAIDLDIYCKPNVYCQSDGDRVVVDFLEPGHGKSLTGPRLVAETLFVFNQHWHDRPAAKHRRIEVRWTAEDAHVPTAGVLLVTRKGIVDLDLDDLWDRANEMEAAL